jgi:hypothetical protein
MILPHRPTSLGLSPSYLTNRAASSKPSPSCSSERTEIRSGVSAGGRIFLSLDGDWMLSHSQMVCDPIMGSSVPLLGTRTGTERVDCAIAMEEKEWE